MPPGRTLDPNDRDYADRVFGIDFSQQDPYSHIDIATFHKHE